MIVSKFTNICIFKPGTITSYIPPQMKNWRNLYINTYSSFVIPADLNAKSAAKLTYIDLKVSSEQGLITYKIPNSTVVNIYLVEFEEQLPQHFSHLAINFYVKSKKI